VNSSEPQLKQLVRLVIRTRWFIPIALAGAIAVAIAASAYLRVSYKASYVSEAIALARPLAVFEIPSPQGGVVNRIGEDKSKGKASFLPRPLDVTDYALLIESDEVLAAVAEVYNSRFSPETPMSGAELKGMLTATTRLEIKTPYEAKYHPTIEMCATASTPEAAYQLASAWVEAAEQWTQDISASVRERTLAYVDREYQKARNELNELDAALIRGGESGASESRPLRRELQTQAAIVTSLAEARMQAQLAMANIVPEFEVVAKPVQPAWRGRPRQTHFAIAAFAVAFVCLWAAAALTVVFRDIAGNLEREESANTIAEVGEEAGNS